MLAALCAASSAMAAASFATTDVAVYRLWPKTGDAASFGLTNVDSGDAGGDALFGLSQLLLPQLCAVEPSFLWCENRGHLSGGKQWMVYTEYTVTTKSAFGEYGADTTFFLHRLPSGHQTNDGDTAYVFTCVSTQTPVAK
jgi:hypothetical protein